MQLLIVETRTSTTRHHELGGAPLTAGSGFECDLVLPGDDVATRHFRLEPTADGYRVQDLETPSGTLLNGKPVARAALGIGDVITMGTYVITLLPAAAGVPGAEPAPMAAAPATAPPPMAASAPPGRSATRDRGSRDRSARDRNGRDQNGRTAPPRRQSSSSGGVFIFLFFATALAVAGVLLKDSFTAPKKDTSSVDTKLEEVLQFARDCDFVQAESLLGTLLQGYGDDPRVGPTIRSTERKVRSQRGRYDRLLAELKEAEDQARTDAVEAAASRLERLARDASDLLPLRERAEKALADLQKRMPERFVEYQGLLTDARSFADVKDRAQELLADGNFKEALRLCNLVQLKPGEEADKKAMVARIQDKARVAARPILKDVDEFVDEGRYFPALNMLDESELKHLEGTDVWFDLLERADEVEDKIDENIPAAARPMPRRKHARPRPKSTSQATVPWRGDARRPGAVAAAKVDAAPSLPEETAPVAPARSFDDLLDDGIAHLGQWELVQSTELLGRARDAANGRNEEQLAQRWEERATQPLSLATYLGEALEGRNLSRSPRLSTRDGVDGVFVRVTGGMVFLQTEDRVEQVPVIDLSPASLLTLSGRVRLEPAQVLSRAWLALACEDEAVLDATLKQLAKDDTLKASLDSLLTFRRGLAQVPPNGFFYEDQRWLTFAEREDLRFQRQLDTAFTSLGGDPEQRAEARGDLLEIAQREPARLVEAVERWQARLKTEYRKIPEREKLQDLRARRLALEATRNTALTLIYDEEKYFYPYRPPQCPPDKARLYPAVQQEVAALVQAVRELWGPEDGECPGPSVSLSKETRELLVRVRELRTLRKELAGWRFEDDPGMLEMLALPADAPTVDLRTYSLSMEERERLDQDRLVALTNAAAVGADPDEHEQVRITNNYRVMMGRSRLAWNEKLYRASRSHSEWMARVGRLSHYSDEPGRRTPMDRMRQEGYERPAGENISMGRGGAQRAHDGWCGSSGHHRNLLWRGHREMGSATSGRFWTQSFGGGSEFRGNLIGE